MFLCKSESWKWIELHSTVSDAPQKRDLRADGTAVTLLDEETSAPGEKVQCSRLAFQARILSRLPLFKDQEDGFNSLILIWPGSSGDELDKGADTAQRGERDDGRGRRGHRHTVVEILATMRKYGKKLTISISNAHEHDRQAEQNPNLC